MKIVKKLKSNIGIYLHFAQGIYISSVALEDQQTKLQTRSAGRAEVFSIRLHCDFSYLLQPLPSTTAASSSSL